MARINNGVIEIYKITTDSFEPITLEDVHEMEDFIQIIGQALRENANPEFHAFIEKARQSWLHRFDKYDTVKAAE